MTNCMTGKNRELQRITVPYAKVLGITDDNPSVEGGDAMIS